MVANSCLASSTGFSSDGVIGVAVLVGPTVILLTGLLACSLLNVGRRSSMAVLPEGGSVRISYMLLTKSPTPTAMAAEAKANATLSGSVCEEILMLT